MDNIGILVTDVIVPGPDDIIGFHVRIDIRTATKVNSVYITVRDINIFPEFGSHLFWPP